MLPRLRFYFVRQDSLVDVEMHTRGEHASSRVVVAALVERDGRAPWSLRGFVVSFLADSPYPVTLAGNS